MSQPYNSVPDTSAKQPVAERAKAPVGSPYLWICIVPGQWEPENIRAWTRDPDRAAQLVAQGLDMKPLYLEQPQSPRDDIAKAILVGLGIFSNAEQRWNEGGPWAEAARGAADAVLSLTRPNLNSGS